MLSCKRPTSYIRQFFARLMMMVAVMSPPGSLVFTILRAAPHCQASKCSPIFYFVCLVPALSSLMARAAGGHISVIEAC